jgi:proline iminopeptidase
MGGISALYAAQHPERVENLILMCPVSPRSNAPYDDPEEAEKKAVARLDQDEAAQLERMQELGEDRKDPAQFCWDNIRVYYPSKMGKPEALSRMRSDPCVYENEWSHNISRHWKKRFPPSSLERDWRSAAGEIKARTLVVHGAEDLIPVEASREWAQYIPDARLLLIPDVGHMPHLEAPEIFFPAVEDFLSGEWPNDAVIVPSSLGNFDDLGKRA